MNFARSRRKPHHNLISVTADGASILVLLSYNYQTAVASWEPGATTGLSDERAVFAPGSGCPSVPTVVIWLSSVCGSLVTVTEIASEVPEFFAVSYWAVSLAT